MVAKSYQKFPTIGEPYKKNGRSYILVEKSDHTTKEVRYYTAVEYAKMYGEPIQSPYTKPLSEVLGFRDSHITIFNGYTEDDTMFFANHGCTFHRMLGWCLAGDKEIFELPSHIKSCTLNWEEVCDETKTRLRAENIVINIVNKIKKERSR